MICPKCGKENDDNWPLDEVLFIQNGKIIGKIKNIGNSMFNPQPKHTPYRNKKVRQFAKGQPCQFRGPT